MISQVIDLTSPKIFENYRSKYGYAWEFYHAGLFGLEIRKLNDDECASLKKELHVFTNSYLIESSNNNSRILLLGNAKVFHEFAERFVGDATIPSLIEKTLINFENYDSVTYEIKGREFNFNLPYVMGILNVTPDSFSDGGKYYDPLIAAEYGIEMFDRGSDIIDIGGESSRPGAQSISADEELNRVIPVIQKILLERPAAIISIDTVKNAVATEALRNGAVIINDISGLSNDSKILETAKKFKASLVIMHMLGNPKTMQSNPEYENVVEEIYDFLFEKTETASSHNIKNIFIDPGIGFGKTVGHNFEIIQRLSDFKSLGYPILFGASKKSFLGKLLGVDVEIRETATSIVETLAVKSGARIIRTHSVSNGVQLCKLFSNVN